MLNSLVLAAQLMGEDKTRLACLDLFYTLFTTIMQFSYVSNFSSLKYCAETFHMKAYYSYLIIRIIYFYFVLKIKNCEIEFIS